MTRSQCYASLSEISSFEKFKRVVFYRVVVYPRLNPADIIDDGVGFYWVAGSSRGTGLVEQLTELASFVGCDPSPGVVSES